MKTLRILVIAITAVTINSGLLYANPEYSLDSNVEVAQLSTDAARTSETECCARCDSDKAKKAETPKTEVRPEYPVREWSGRDR